MSELQEVNKPPSHKATHCYTHYMILYEECDVRNSVFPQTEDVSTLLATCNSVYKCVHSYVGVCYLGYQTTFLASVATLKTILPM